MKLPTRAVHGHELLQHPEMAVNGPIYQSSAFAFRNFAEMQAYASGQIDRYMYSRYANPTTDEVEKRLAALEQTEAAIVSSSGMASTLICLLAAVNPGEEVLALEAIYGGTYKLIRDLAPRCGIKVKFLAIEDLTNLAAQASPQSRLLWLETPTNPTNRLIDLADLCRQAHQLNLLVAVDNTFASPINQLPISLGADIVVHSATKYLGGHDDLTAGLLAGSHEFINKARFLHKLIGTTLDPQAAALLIRGLKTLDVRMQRINSNSLALANWLNEQPQIQQVFYPFLSSAPQFSLAQHQMTGGSGIVTIELVDGTAAQRFIDGLRLIQLVPTLGGVETKVSYPLYTSHVGLSEQERQRAGVSAGTVRFAVGIEAIDDIIADIAQALRQI